MRQDLLDFKSELTLGLISDPILKFLLLKINQSVLFKVLKKLMIPYYNDSNEVKFIN